MTTTAEKKPPRTRSQNGRRSRAKGADFEREVVRELRPVYPAAERCIAQVRTASREGCDVEGTPWWIECKVGAAPNVLGAMRQARRDRGEDPRPVVVIAQRTREPATVTMELGTFMVCAQADAAARAFARERGEARAEVERLRTLPVIATCGQCGWARDGGRITLTDAPAVLCGLVTHNSAGWRKPVAHDAEPPGWCPMRRPR